MNTGKAIAQAGHAYLGAFINAEKSLQADYHSELPTSPGTKVCLACKSLAHLIRAEEEAKAAGIPVFRVVDSGCENFFNGEPTITALGLGPASKNKIQHITRKFQLL